MPKCLRQSHLAWMVSLNISFHWGCAKYLLTNGLGGKVEERSANSLFLNCLRKHLCNVDAARDRLEGILS